MPFQNTCKNTITTDIKEQKVSHCTLFVILRIHKQEEMPFKIMLNISLMISNNYFTGFKKKKKRKENLISISATGLNATRLSNVHL